MDSREYSKMRAALLRDAQKGENEYKKGVAHLELARLSKLNNNVQEALIHYIKAAKHFRQVNEVQAATLFEESESLCYQTDNIELGAECLRFAFECFQNVGWEDRCDLILERIIAIGRTDIADELSKYSIKHKSEILLFQVKDLKAQIKKKKLQTPDIIDQSIMKVELGLKKEEYENCIKYAQEAKTAGEELLRDQQEALESMRVVEGELREMKMQQEDTIIVTTSSAKEALNRGQFKETKRLADKAIKDAREILKKQEEEKQLAEEKRRKEERRRIELEEEKRREEERNRREAEEKAKERFKWMSELNRIESASESEPPKPRLLIDFKKNKEYTRNMWGECEVELRNESRVDVRNICVTVEDGGMSYREKKIPLLVKGESHKFKLSIKPRELGDSVPLDLIVDCQDGDGNKYTFSESDGIKVTDKIVEKVPEKVEYHTHIQSGGDLSIGSNFNKDGVQMRPELLVGQNLPGLNQPINNVDSKERYQKYKTALRQWYDHEVDDDYMDKVKAILNITLREHENLEIEVKKEVEIKSKGELLF
jgi:hypothetical protein